MENQDAYDTFIDSMTVTREMDHDGVGYDLDALHRIMPPELPGLVMRMAPCRDWRDVEALAAIVAMDEDDVSEVARNALRARANGREQDKVALRAAKALDELGEPSPAREAKVVETLLKMQDDGAFAEAFDQSEHYRSEAVKLALLRCAKEHPSRGCISAAMLYFHCGLAGEAFDWDHRPFFLRFNPGDEADRAKAFAELCEKTGLKLE